jgi:two-component system chemotaxis sensor kinase CheA
LLALLCASGMSTARRADTVSGRGVGLSAVRRAVEDLHGTLAVRSESGRGTLFELFLPLTLATDTGLFVQTGDARFVLPSAAVQRVVSFNRKDVSVTETATSLWHAGQHVPLARLQPSLQLARYQCPANGQSELAVILAATTATAAIVVNEIQGEAEVVVRSLGPFVRRLRNVSGLTIGASGEMQFVLNPADLVHAVLHPAGAASVAPEQPSRAEAEADEGEEKTILVVDDSVTSRLLNQELLAASGFRVLTANDGQQALKVLATSRCDLVLADVQMPKLDGYELTRRIKQDPQLAHIPVVLLTTLAGREHQERGIEVGADAYLVKREVSQTELVDTINQFI